MTAWFQTYQSGRPGRYGIAPNKLKAIDFESAAYITVSVVLNSLTNSDASFQSVAVQVGKAVEDELRLRKFSKENNPYFKAVLARIKQKPHLGYKRQVLIHAMNNGAKIHWQDWTPTEKLHVGKVLVEILLTATGIITIEKRAKRKGKFLYCITMKNDVATWITETHAILESHKPAYFPMLVPPNPWRSPFEGGYYSDLILSKRFVKKTSSRYLQELANSDIDKVYKAVNTVQETPWQINPKVLSVLSYFWEQNSQIAGLPNREQVDHPPSPLPEGMDTKTLTGEAKLAHENWCREVAEIYSTNRSRVSKVIQTAMILSMAKRFKDDTIYFPCAIDWRGRLYPLPNYLNPQGNDFARGLLLFNNGKPIQSKTAENWLAIHGANTFGRDKVPFEARIAFIQEKTPDILKVAADPYTHQFWTEADKPWQFLAFCFEWAGYHADPDNFVSRLPVQLDGTCNGLQHFSAMLRDEVGGRAVNLVPCEHPQDIYQQVADQVIERLKKEAKTASSQSHLAVQWLLLDGAVSRGLTKKPVMVLPYGGTRQGNRAAIQAYLKKYCEQKGLTHSPFGSAAAEFEACVFMRDIVWESIGDVVIAARQAMDWLRRVAQLVSTQNIPITWTSPSGLPVQQRKLALKPHRVKTVLLGATVYLGLKLPDKKIDKMAAQNGISPNFVHALDAAALHIYVNKMAEKGVTQLSMIHDSYGTLAADTQQSTELLRDAFIEIYQNNVLAHFKDELKKYLPTDLFNRIPEIPEFGSLNIDEIKNALFFFV